jgi:hypothetical protein
MLAARRFHHGTPSGSVVTDTAHPSWGQAIKNFRNYQNAQARREIARPLSLSG